jgi:hypothetical protein
MRNSRDKIRKIIAEQLEIELEKLEDLEATEDAWAGGENLVHDLDHSKITGGESNVASPETLEIIVAEVRRRIQEMQAHSRPGDLKQPRPEETEFPVVVGYSINGQPQSEIAYDDEELTQILDYLAPLSPGAKQIPYSIDSLSDVEAADVPVGSRIERYSEAKDQNKDGKNDFEDVKIARMRASGMSDAEIKEKHPELFENTLRRQLKKITRRQLQRIIREAMGQDGAFPDLSHPLIAPYADKMGRAVKGREGKWFVEYQSYSYNAGGQSNQSITVYLLPDGKYTARVGGNFNNTISGRIGKDFDDPESAIEAALNSGPSATGPTAAQLLKKVGEKVSTRGYIGQD